MRPRALFVALVLLLLAMAPSSATALTLQKVGGSFPDAIHLSSDPTDPERLLVVDRNGRVLLFEKGLTTVLANIEDKVSCCEREQGLLSVAPAPDFAFSGRLYVDYTGVEQPGGEIHVAELDLNEPGGPTLEDLLVIEHPEVEDKIHYGGQLQFGPEGNLFISTGDGGPANDTDHNAQDLDKLLGKILRVKPNPAVAKNYEIPAGNPFAGPIPGADEIWSYGLRNPFRFSFDRLTGAMLIGDVGQAAREEVDYAPPPSLGAGFNWGWSCREGLIEGPGEGDDPACPPVGFVDPIFDYTHVPGGPCAIIGGYVARDPQLPELLGRYVYGDFCTGEIRSLDLSNPFGTDRYEGVSLDRLESFGEDAAGRLYAVAGGGVYHLATSEQPPVAAGQPGPMHAHIGIRAVSRPLRRGGRATITAFVSPCVRDKARSVQVTLLRGRRKLQRRHMSRVCTVAFRPRVPRKAKFRAKLLEGSVYFAAESRRLTIKPQRPHRRR
jgi:glucose/arabinose dehydrogenase